MKETDEYKELLQQVNLLRRVMPSIIANEIIGVAPMMAPTGQIFTMRERYGVGIFFDRSNKFI